MDFKAFDAAAAETFEERVIGDVDAAIASGNLLAIWEPGMLERLGALDETDCGVVKAKLCAAFGATFLSKEFDKALKMERRKLRRLSQKADQPRAIPPAGNSLQVVSGADSPLSPGGPPELLHFLQNDHGNSERLVAMYGDDLRYCPPMKKWLCWDGNRWAVDTSDHARRLVKNTMLEYLRQALAESYEPAEKFARASLDSKRISNALKEAQDQIFIMPADLDKDQFVLNFINGTVDLRTGQRRDHRRMDWITKVVQYNFNPEAECPRFMRFLEEVTGGGPDAGEGAIESSGRLIDYLQVAFGYTLTGVTSEKAVFLLHGPRDNGKSTLLATILKLLDEYSVLLQIDTLMVKSGGESNNQQADLADLRGARFVMTSETEEGQRLAEGKLKRITQGIGRIKAVRKYENPIEFDESHKLWIDANHLPVVRSHDDATWRRLHAVPFTVIIPKERQDRGLGAALLTEAEGILAWAVRGAVEWYRTGLKKPQELEQTATVWRSDMNQVGRFAEESCAVGQFAQARSRELFQAYQRWAEGGGEQAMAERAFGDRVLEITGVSREKKTFGSVFVGIGLKATDRENGDWKG
jgi:putative DNA primase/helicase